MANSDFVTLGQSKSQLKAIKKYINDKFRDYDKQSSGDSISGGWIYNSDTSIAAYERVYEYRKKNEVAIQPVQALNKLTISGQKVTIPAGEIKATVDAENYFLTFNGSGNDTIKILDSAENVSLNAGNGNNFITNSSAGCVISCGTGADTIISDGSGCSVIGGTGNDYLYVVGGSCSVEGGAGNNLVTISGGNNLFVTNCNGNNSIYGAQAGDTLSIVGGGYKNVSVGDGYLDYITGGATSNGLDYTDYHTYVYGDIADSDLTVETVATIESLKINVPYKKITLNKTENIAIASVGEDKTGYSPHYNGNLFSDSIFCANNTSTVDNYVDNITLVAGSNNGANFAGGTAVVNNYGNNVFVLAGAYQSYTCQITTNYGNNVTLRGAFGDDGAFATEKSLIKSYGRDVLILSNKTTSNWPSYPANTQNTVVTISGGSATLNYFNKILVDGNNTTVKANSVNSVITIFSGTGNSIIYPAGGNDKIINNGSGNVFYYAGNVAEGTDTISAWNGDTIAIGDPEVTITDAVTDSVDNGDSTVEGNTKLTITKANVKSYVVIQGKGTGDTLSVILGDTNRTYTIGTGLS